MHFFTSRKLIVQSEIANLKSIGLYIQSIADRVKRLGEGFKCLKAEGCPEDLTEEQINSEVERIRKRLKDLKEKSRELQKAYDNE